MAEVVFVPNPAGIAAVGVSADMARTLEQIGQVVADVAQSRAPVGKTGNYSRSFMVELVVDKGVVGARVYNTDWKAGWLEFGTVNTPKFATLRTAAELSGLDVQEAR